MNIKILKGVISVISICIGLGMLVEMNQNDDMDVLSTFFAIVILTLCNAKMIMDEYTKNDNYDVTLEKGTCSIVNPTIDMSQVTFNDKTFTYDGLLHTLSVENLPANVKVEYLVDGIEFTGTKNSGTYIVTAKFTVTNDNYVLSIDSLNATLQINKRSITLKPNVESLTQLSNSFIKTSFISALMPLFCFQRQQHNRIFRYPPIFLLQTFCHGL